MASQHQRGTEMKKYVAWPPHIKHIVALGHLHDASGNSYPRQGGRSSELPNGQAVFQFNKTFCHNAAGQFLGLIDSTVSLVTDFSNPTVSTYLAPSTARGVEVSERQIPALIPRFPDELDNKKMRRAFYCFGGISWYLFAGCALGWTFYEEHIVHKDGSSGVLAVGIASVDVDYRSNPMTIEAEREPLHGVQRILFFPSEPRFGTFSVHDDGTYLYAYGHALGDYNGCYDVLCGRVLLNCAKSRSYWRFWGGGRGWIENWRQAIPVLTSYKHGQIFHTRLFGEGSPYRLGFVGCTTNGDSKLMFGRARAPEGPFETVELMTAYPLGHLKNFKHTSCMYAHPWAFSESKGDLMVTWSEGGPEGNVVAIKIRFEQGIGRAQPPELQIGQSIHEESDDVTSSEEERRKRIEDKYSLEAYEEAGVQSISASSKGKGVFGKAAAAFAKLSCTSDAA